MAKKGIRSFKGREVDMDALRVQNERNVAVGNMRVNARGDVIDSKGNVVQNSKERVRKQRNVSKTVSNVSVKNKINEDFSDDEIGNTKQEEETQSSKTETHDKKNEKLDEDGNIIIDYNENDGEDKNG